MPHWRNVGRKTSRTNVRWPPDGANDHGDIGYEAGHPFVVGDLVRCIMPRCSDGRLSPAIYTVTEVDTYETTVGPAGSWSACRFEFAR